MKLNKVKISKEDECTRIIEIEVPKEEIELKRESVINAFCETTQIPGFRTGKVPRDIVIKKFEKEINEELIKQIFSSSLEEVLSKENFEIVSDINVFDVKWKENFSFKVKFEIIPPFDLPNYKGVKIEMEKISVSENDVDNLLKSLQEQNAEYVPVYDREVRKDDMIIVDIKGYIDGKVIDKFSQENFPLFIGKNEIKELEEGFLNAKINEEREINVNLPLDYFDKEFAGKNILFKGFVKEIKEKRLPPLDNEFAKLFKCDSLEKLKEEARIIIEEDKKRKYKEDAKMKIVKELLKSAKFEIPSSLVKKEYEYLLKVYKNKENDEALYEYAKERVKLHLLLYEIAKVENLIAENEEVEKVIKSIISQPNIDKEKKKVLLSQRGRENIKYDLTLEKTLEFLFNKACIIEK